MIQFQIDYERCLGPTCRKCVTHCPIKVLGVKEKKIVAARPEACILCHTCKGACPVHLSVIEMEEKEV